MAEYRYVATMAAGVAVCQGMMSNPNRSWSSFGNGRNFTSSSRSVSRPMPAYSAPPQNDENRQASSASRGSANLAGQHYRQMSVSVPDISELRSPLQQVSRDHGLHFAEPQIARLEIPGNDEEELWRIDESKFSSQYNLFARQIGLPPLQTPSFLESVEQELGKYSTVLGSEPAKTQQKGFLNKLLRRSTGNDLRAKPEKENRKSGLILEAHQAKAKDLSPSCRNLSEMIRLGGVSMFTLPHIYAPTNMALPVCICACATYLIQNGTSTPGIFRISGWQLNINNLFDYYVEPLKNLGPESCDIQRTVSHAVLPSHIAYSTHDIASLFKKLLFNLPGGILGSTGLFLCLQDVLSCTDSKIATRMMSLAISSVKSQYRKSLICSVFGLLAMIGHTTFQASKQEDVKERMTYESLGIIFGPLLLGNLSDSSELDVSRSPSSLQPILESPISQSRKVRTSFPIGKAAVPPKAFERAKTSIQVCQMLIKNWQEVVKQLRELGAVTNAEELIVRPRHSTYQNEQSVPPAQLARHSSYDVPLLHRKGSTEDSSQSRYPSFRPPFEWTNPQQSSETNWAQEVHPLRSHPATEFASAPDNLSDRYIREFESAATQLSQSLSTVDSLPLQPALTQKKLRPTSTPIVKPSSRSSLLERRETSWESNLEESSKRRQGGVWESEVDAQRLFGPDREDGAAAKLEDRSLDFERFRQDLRSKSTQNLILGPGTARQPSRGASTPTLSVEDSSGSSRMSSAEVKLTELSPRWNQPRPDPPTMLDKRLTDSSLSELSRVSLRMSAFGEPELQLQHPQTSNTLAYQQLDFLRPLKTLDSIDEGKTSLEIADYNPQNLENDEERETKPGPPGLMKSFSTPPIEMTQSLKLGSPFKSPSRIPVPKGSPSPSPKSKKSLRSDTSPKSSKSPVLRDREVPLRESSLQPKLSPRKTWIPTASPPKTGEGDIKETSPSKGSSSDDKNSDSRAPVADGLGLTFKGKSRTSPSAPPSPNQFPSFGFATHLGPRSPRPAISPPKERLTDTTAIASPSNPHAVMYAEIQKLKQQLEAKNEEVAKVKQELVAMREVKDSGTLSDKLRAAHVELESWRTRAEWAEKNLALARQEQDKWVFTPADGQGQ